MRKPISILLLIAMIISVITVLPLTATAEDEEAFTAVQLSLGYNIGITYYTNIDYVSGITAQVTINGRTDTVKAAYANGKISFSFNGIAPHELGATISTEVYKNNAATGITNETTVKEVCELYLETPFINYDESVKSGIYKLVSNLLQYGEYARIYKGVSGSIISDITSENYVPDELVTPTGTSTTSSSNENLSLRGLNVFFDTMNRYYIKFTSTDISKVKFMIGNNVYTEFGEDSGYYFFYTNPVSAKDTNDVISIKGYYNNEIASEINYSIEQYIIDLVSISASTNMQNLAKSLYKYGESATVYARLSFQTVGFDDGGFYGSGDSL